MTRRTPILAAAALAVLLAAGGCHRRPAHGVVVQRVYVPASWSTGSSYGKGGTRFTSTTTAESFTLIVRNDDGTTVTRTVSADTYGRCPEGARYDDAP